MISAIKLDDSQVSALKAKLESISGKNILLNQKTDEAVLGNILFKGNELVLNSSSSEIASSSSSGESSVVLPVAHAKASYSFKKLHHGYHVHFEEPGAHQVYVLNLMGQIISHKNVYGTDAEFVNLPKGRYMLKVK